MMAKHKLPKPSTKFVGLNDKCPSAFPVDATTAKMRRKKMKVKLCATPEMAAKIKAKHGR